jgi:hypothetical protein
MRLREAFVAAIRGRQKSLAIEHFGESGGGEMSRIASGERRPTWEVLEDAFDEAPDALADYCRERFGWRIEKPTAPLAQQLELFGAQLHSLVERFAEFSERQREAEKRAPMAKAGGRERDARRRA